MNMESKITFLTLKRQFLYLQLLEENDEIIKRKIEDIDNEILLIICDLKRASSVKSKEILAEVVKNTYYYDSNSSKILFYLFDQQLGSVPKEFLMQNQHNNDIFLLPTSYEFDFPDDIPCMTKQHLKYRLLQEHKKTVDEELKKLRRYIDYPLYGKSITNESVKNKQSHEIRKSSLKPNLSTKTITNNNNNININDKEITNKQINRKSEENEQQQQQSKEIINNIPTNEDEIDISSDSGLSYDEIEENPEQLKKKQSKNDKNDNFEDCTDYDLIEFASDLEEYSSDSDNTLSPLEDEEKGNNNNNNNIQQTKRLYSNVNMNNTNDNNNNEISNPLKKRLYTPLQENEINQNQQQQQISLPLPPAAPLISPSNPNEQQQQQQQLNKRIRKRKRQFSDEDESGEDSKEEDYLQYEDDLNDEDYNMGSTYNKKSKKKKTATKKQDKNDNEIIDIKEEEVEVVEEKFSYGTLRQYLISANIPMFSPRDKLNIRYIPIVFATPTISLNVSSST